ncbi:hypothetical protein FGU65_08245 [Methanoculleus sp. FWC-SCC1]|uniref:Uncharacterized protein n=1 Tax=Methanoculleus frigidifontis TaxID=2584085 RepID=A0ABT8MAB3_9EURY|nr:hypothetical protein [Methanoculleus sp. FWC-SCC1]MDN7024876.1 hypothetical protein [Methanoculleus sp. FWC-SCC1]
MPAEKKCIIEELGEGDLLLPGLVNTALVANDRIKYYFTLLQTACDRADHPNREFPTLRMERESAGVENAALDDVVAGTRVSGIGVYSVPCAGEIFAAVRGYMQEMALPVISRGGQGVEAFESRLSALLAELPKSDAEPVAGSVIWSITSGDRSAGDSLHLLVMDLHKELNALQRSISRENIDGAQTYLLGDGDADRVAVFMAGLNRTAPLKFDHPGLGTTATRTGRKLVLQNDIGLTDAHVLVITVEEMTVTITYTDVHMPRLQFFHSLFEAWDVAWEDTLSRRGSTRLEENLYHLSVGRYTARDESDLRAFLMHLGSRLVFLIDWNRARKRLGNFLRNKDAVTVLKRAADNEYGHMAFLKLGGERLIYDALELAAGMPLRYGEPLHQILGREKTVEYLQWVLRTASVGLCTNRSLLLVQDEIKAELLGYFRSAREKLLEVCEEHAVLAVEVATVLRDSLLVLQRGGEIDFICRSAQRAKRWERRADEYVTTVRSLSRRIEAAEFFFELIGVADDVVDCLEEACFFVTLVPSFTRSPGVYGELGNLAEIALMQGQEFVKALIAVQCVHRGGDREDMQVFLEAVDRMVGLEQECDEALRQAEKRILLESTDYREMRVAFELARTIEESTNASMKAAYILRDNILEGMGR